MHEAKRCEAQVALCKQRHVQLTYLIAPCVADGEHVWGIVHHSSHALHLLQRRPIIGRGVRGRWRGRLRERVGWLLCSLLSALLVCRGVTLCAGENSKPVLDWPVLGC